MRIAWFTHRYHPCVGGAENYGRAMVRRFVAAGHSVDVLTSDAHDLWYFTDGRRRRVEAPGPLVLAGRSPPCFERFRAPWPDGPPAWLSLLGPLPLDRRADFFAALD